MKMKNKDSHMDNKYQKEKPIQTDEKSSGYCYKQWQLDVTGYKPCQSRRSGSYGPELTPVMDLMNGAGYD